MVEIARAEIPAARERRSTPVTAAEACAGSLHAEGRAARDGVTFRARDRGQAVQLFL